MVASALLFSFSIVLCENFRSPSLSLLLLRHQQGVATIASRLRLFSRAHALSSATSRARLMPGPPPAEMAGISDGAGAAGAGGATTNLANVGSIASSRRAASGPSSSSSPPRGAFIVLEGVDRCGKTTQCARLVERLRESGVRGLIACFSPSSSTSKRGAFFFLFLLVLFLFFLLLSPLSRDPSFPGYPKHPKTKTKTKPKKNPRATINRSRPRCGGSPTGPQRSAR